MSNTVFTELRFWLLVVFSVVIPAGIYGLLLVKRAISRPSVLGFGLVLVFTSGVDVYLLQSLSNLARASSSLSDDVLFVSEVSLALYLLPVLFGGIGVNLISHVLISHLVEAEQRFKRDNPDAG